MKNPNPITFILNTGLGIPVYLGSIICDTDELLNRYQEDEYAFRSLSSYEDIESLFQDNGGSHYTLRLSKHGDHTDATETT